MYNLGQVFFRVDYLGVGGRASLVAQMVKNLPVIWDLPCVGKISWRRAWQPIPVFLPGESPGQRTSFQATVYKVAKRHTWLKWHSMHAQTHTQLSEWQNLECCRHQMLPKTWNNRNSYPFLVEIQNGTAILENILAVSYKAKHTLWY